MFVFVEAEALNSSYRVSYGMVMNLVRCGEGMASDDNDNQEQTSTSQNNGHNTGGREGTGMGVEGLVAKSFRQFQVEREAKTSLITGVGGGGVATATT